MTRERSLLDLLERDDYSPPLTARERRRLVIGYTIATLLAVAFVVFVSLAGQS